VTIANNNSFGDSMIRPFPSGKTPAKPGAALKRLRAERGWTLEEVSQRTGLAVSTLSKAENDKIALTFDKLVLISEALQIDIAQLFGSSSGAATHVDGGTRRSIARAGEGRSIETAKGNYLYVAAELLNKRFIPIIGEVFARDISEYEELTRHHGEEFVYVLQGTLELHTEMYTPARLAQGDSVFFDSGMGHAYVAVGDEPCRILSMCATPESQLIGALEGKNDAGALGTAPLRSSQAKMIPAAAASEATAVRKVAASSKKPAPKANKRFRRS
jgi:transcriptional regulator with XRE-family HTH domain